MKCATRDRRFHGGSLIGSIGISGPAARFGVPRMRELGAYLTQRVTTLQ